MAEAASGAREPPRPGRKPSHQRCFTEEFAPMYQVPGADVEEGVAAAPVGELGEGVSGQDVLGEQRESEVAQLDCLASVSSAPAQRHHPHEAPQALR